jgi:hypothetical protein
MYIRVLFKKQGVKVQVTKATPLHQKTVLLLSLPLPLPLPKI